MDRDNELHALLGAPFPIALSPEEEDWSSRGVRVTFYALRCVSLSHTESLVSVAECSGQVHDVNTVVLVMVEGCWMDITAATGVVGLIPASSS